MIDAYLRSEHHLGHSDCTVQARSYLLRRWERHTGGRLIEATKEDVLAFLDDDVSLRTRYWRISNLSAFYQWAIIEEHTDVDPTARVKRPKLPRRKPRPASRDVYRQAYEAGDKRMRAMLALGALAGLRCKEIAGLHVDDIDFEAGTLRVETGKGGHQRVVPIPDALVGALKAWVPPDGWVFPSSKNGSHMTPASVSNVINAHFRGLGFPTTAHQLRHLYGTTACEMTDIETAQELMGHADIGTTRGYVAVSPEKKEKIRGIRYS